MKKITLSILLVLTVLSSFSQWNLVWSDEFNYTGEPDANKWSYDPGPNPWNNEMQYYTEGLGNTKVEGGNLVMEVKQESTEGKNYTSSRINTKTKANWTYGKMEARMKLTKGDKLWPAFWMMPETDTYGTWPASGEIDIMEHWSWDSEATFGNYHCADYFAKYGLRQQVGDPSTSWHVYGVEWTPTEIKWLFDDVVFASYTNPGTGSSAWPFDKPFYIIFNIAVEEGAAGLENTWTKKTIEVDYVRVYTQGPVVPVTGIDLSTNSTTVTKFGTQQLTATVLPADASNKDVSWTSSNPAIVQVNTSGMITGISDGEAIITATTTDGNKTATCAVTLDGTAPCSLLTVFGVPSSTSLPALETTYTNAHVLGTDGPDLRNLTSFQINWDANNKALYTFAFNTNNGVPDWWFDLNSKTVQIFGSAQPSCTITGSGIDGFDGDYYVNVDGDNFVMVATNSTYAVYFSNSSIAPDGCSQSSTDTEAPTTPSNLTAVSLTTSIQLSWSASTDNVAVTGYEIYNGSTLLTTTTNTFYVVDALNESTAYTFKVSAVDAAGNNSATAVVNTSTTAFSDAQAPTTPSNFVAVPSTTTVQLSWSASSDNVAVTGYEIYNGSTFLTITTSTSFVVNGLNESTAYTFKVSAIDAVGNNSSQATINTVTSASSTGDFSLLVEAEDYSTMSGIQTENCSEGGENVGWIDAGDWMVYNVTIPETAAYLVSYRIASQNGGGALSMQKDAGTTVLGEISIPSTNGWQNWTSINHVVTLPAGTFDLSIVATSGGFNINNFTISKTEETTNPFEILIEAEDYVESFGIKTQVCSEGTLNVGWTNTGDWMAYDVNIPSSGTYTIDFRVASNANGGNIGIENFGGSPVYNTISFVATGGWQTWQTVSTTVNLSAGNQTIALAALSGGWNMNWLKISSLGLKKATVAVNESKAIEHYPTLTSSHINLVNLPEMELARIYIYNLEGKLISSESKMVNSSKTIVPVNTLQNGMYFMRIHGQSYSENFRFIKN